MLTQISRFILYGKDSYDMAKKPTMSSWAWGHTQNFLRRRIGLHDVSAPGLVDFARHYADKHLLEWFGVGNRGSLPKGWPSDVFNTMDRIIRARGGMVQVGDLQVPAFTLNRKTALTLTSILVAYVDFNGDGADFNRVKGLEEALEDAISRECRKDMNIRILTKPARIEIDRLDTPTLTLKDRWGQHIDGTVQPGYYLVGIESTPKGDALVHNRLHNANEYSCVWFGASGSGKTQAMTSALLSLAATTSPEELSIIVIDPKAIDFPVDGLPHLACPIINDPSQARTAVMDVAKLLAERAKSKNRDASRKRVLLVVDEMKYLLSQQAEDEQLVNALADIGAMGRAWGISMFVGSQRATNEFFPKRIHSQIPAKWVGRVTDGNEATFASGEKSSDAHKLPGRGAGLLYEPDGIVRLQSTFIGDANKDNYPQVVAPYVKDVQKRWQGKQPHWRMGDALPSVVAVPAVMDAPGNVPSMIEEAVRKVLLEMATVGPAMAPVDMGTFLDDETGKILDEIGDDALEQIKIEYEKDPDHFNKNRMRQAIGRRLSTSKEAAYYEAVTKWLA